jgi:hypothetical protein
MATEDRSSKKQLKQTNSSAKYNPRDSYEQYENQDETMI